METIKCLCGRLCKGLRGLRAHQRTCRTFNDLGNLVEENNQNADVTDVNDLHHILTEGPVTLGSQLLKHGVKLPTSKKALYAEIFKTVRIPSPWKRAVTILIHKKDSTDNPENFRPITRENVTLKIFTTLLSDKIGNSLQRNGYAKKVSCTDCPVLYFEHTSHLSYIINEAGKKQRSLIVTLLDLKNAFGEVNHNLIDIVLEFHHIPREMKQLIRKIYTEFFITITTTAFTSDFIHVGKGVLQGDCLSPLLFNMVINTFIQYIKSEQFQQLGYTFIKFLTPRHWYQFADDAAVISGAFIASA